MWILSLALKIFVWVMVIKNYDTDTIKAIFWLIVWVSLIMEYHINRIIDLIK